VESALLLTGATGFVGAELLPRWLAARPETTVHCLARARDPAELARRRERILAWGRIPERDARRVRFHAGDVSEPDLGLGDRYGALAREVDEVVHAAASTRFDLTVDESRRINVGGLERVVAFARAAGARGGLRRLHYVSTAYAKAEPGAVEPTFRNAYEQSKCEAEQLLARTTEDLPVSCYRPSIIVGDSRTGRTPHFRVLYEPIKWVYYGKTDVLPCRPEVRLDVVPIDWVCDAIVELAAMPGSECRAYPLCCGPDKAISIAEIIEIALESGNACLRELGEPEVAAPRVVTPEDVEAASGEARERLEQIWSVGSEVLRAYAPYMLEEQLFDSAPLPSRIAARCPALRDYLPVLIRYTADTMYEEWAGLDGIGEERQK
jgi:nucleoside-diphosphate-sugar epimerase